MAGLFRKLLGSSNDRQLKKYQPKVQAINALEPEYEKLTDAQLIEKTNAFRQRVKQGAALDALLVEAFALVREGAKRALGQRHYDVQLMGGIVLHEGSIAEMRTGEGKTLVSTLPAYLNALEGKGVHIVTVNDYLAARDAEWMGRVYSALGLTVGCVTGESSGEERQQAYASDITYGTNNEFGFDYLRDNMKYRLNDMAQREHHYAIVDEVDSILIDESRTPLIISGPTEDKTELYQAIDAIIPLLHDEDYEHDEKQNSITFTEEGNDHLEELLGERGLLQESTLYDPINVSVVHHCNQALKAHKIFKKDKDYIVKNGKVVLIDEFTGRMMPGRCLSEGLHQAIEAKEKAQIEPENQTLASITFQNYFRLYQKLSGMTGTAKTEESEFSSIYGLGVVEIPTNKPVARLDDDDVVYRTGEEKYRAIVKDIREANAKHQPILVGTVSIEKSETLSEYLHKEDIPHQVLNARYHEQEARIIANAGLLGAVTIATNMAGRGTDIQLGGNIDMMVNDWLQEQKDKDQDPNSREIERQREKFEAQIADKKKIALEAGGLYVLGTERHESRRIDNQLRGRTGRQGDPGKSKFFISLEDDLLRIFAADRLDGIMRRLGIQEDEAIVHPWMNKAMETSQARIEQRNFEIRKNLLKFDDVINDQRKAIFQQRIGFMKAEDVSETVIDMRHQVIEDIVSKHIPEKAYAEHWDLEGLEERCYELFDERFSIREWAAQEGVANAEIEQQLIDNTDLKYTELEQKISTDVLRGLEKQVLLQSIDHKWREHLAHIDHLRSVIHLRGYAQRDPLSEFKSEAFSLFEALLDDLRSDIIRILFHVEIQDAPEQVDQIRAEREAEAQRLVRQRPNIIQNQFGPAGALSDQALSEVETQTGAAHPAFAAETTGAAGQTNDDERARFRAVSRNAACPCGSGRKFKHCHGSLSRKSA